MRDLAEKSHIDSVPRKQKSGIRALMTEFVNFKYREIVLFLFLKHTKFSFNSMEVLTVQNVIAKNGLIFMHKIIYFPNLPSKSVRETIPNNAPNYSSMHENNMNWLETYNNAGPYFRTSIFYRAPHLAFSTNNEDIIGAACLLSINSYKNSVT